VGSIRGTLEEALQPTQTHMNMSKHVQTLTNVSEHTLDSRTHKNLLWRPLKDLHAPPAIFRQFTLLQIFSYLIVLSHAQLVLHISDSFADTYYSQQASLMYSYIIFSASLLIHMQ
jgi:hypothetical protein